MRELPMLDHVPQADRSVQCSGGQDLHLGNPGHYLSRGVAPVSFKLPMHATLLALAGGVLPEPLRGRRLHPGRPADRPLILAHDHLLLNVPHMNLLTASVRSKKHAPRVLIRFPAVGLNWRPAQRANGGIQTPSLDLGEPRLPKNQLSVIAAGHDPIVLRYMAGREDVPGVPSHGTLGFERSGVQQLESALRGGLGRGRRSGRLGAEQPRAGADLLHRHLLPPRVALLGHHHHQVIHGGPAVHLIEERSHIRGLAGQGVPVGRVPPRGSGLALRVLLPQGR
mmetsp:Transcript_19506/g.44838  ORF Transcript_19506/g.44838 Transcript_19506/m.44838 type:complete len:281 (+) Transcript_19506:627-1469(+)